ncbi:unnamed protein product, partial [Dibothriocephalus latus]
MTSGGEESAVTPKVEKKDEETSVPVEEAETNEQGPSTRGSAKLSFFLADIPPSEHTHYLLALLSSALKNGLTVKTPFKEARDRLSSLFVKPLSAAAAGAQFYNLRQKRQQSADDFARELERLASLAYASTPPEERNEIVLDRFIVGLNDPTLKHHLAISRPHDL